MKSFIETLITEKKDHIINKLPSLSPEEKELLINFFNKNPHLESKINWNNKRLIFNDFKSVMSIVSKTRLSKEVKHKGISGLREGIDYIDMSEMFHKEGYTFDAYAPLTHHASQLIASHKIGKCEGAWCTASNDPRRWNEYTSQGIALIYIIHSDGDKTAIACNSNGDIEMFDAEDNSDTGSDRSNSMERLLKKNLRVIETIIANTKQELDDWIKAGKTRNAKWLYHRTKWIMYEGEWLSGDWYDGIMSDWYSTGSKPSFIGGVAKKGFFNAGAQIRGGEFRGVATVDGATWYETATWVSGTWKNGLDSGGYPQRLKPTLWNISHSIIQQLHQYYEVKETFNMDNLISDTTGVLDYLLDVGKSGAVKGYLKPHPILTFENGRYVIESAVVKDTKKRGPYVKIKFINCNIWETNTQQTDFYNCWIYGGSYTVSQYFGTIKECITMDSAKFWMMEKITDFSKDNVTVRGGVFADPNAVGKDAKFSNKYIYNREFANATFENMMIVQGDYYNCTFKSCKFYDPAFDSMSIFLHNCKEIDCVEQVNAPISRK